MYLLLVAWIWLQTRLMSLVFVYVSVNAKKSVFTWFYYQLLQSLVSFGELFAQIGNLRNITLINNGLALRIVPLTHSWLFVIFRVC